jgi:hypothetical protein
MLYRILSSLLSFLSILLKIPHKMFPYNNLNPNQQNNPNPNIQQYNVFGDVNPYRSHILNDPNMYGFGTFSQMLSPFGMMIPNVGPQPNQFQPPNSSDFIAETQPFGSPNQSTLPPSSNVPPPMQKTKRKHKRKETEEPVKSTKQPWTPKEEEMLAASYVDVSEDPKVGKRLIYYFFKIKKLHYLLLVY